MQIFYLESLINVLKNVYLLGALVSVTQESFLAAPTLMLISFPTCSCWWGAVDWASSWIGWAGPSWMRGARSVQSALAVEASWESS